MLRYVELNYLKLCYVTLRYIELNYLKLRYLMLYHIISYYIGIWLHVSTTSGHLQATKIYKIEITIAKPTSL
jgi:hypothetical protein